MSAEQLVQAGRDRNEAEKARAALRSELGNDDLPQAYARLAMSSCLAAQLTQLDHAITEPIDRLQFLQMARAYQPPIRTWDSEAWKAVTATGALSNNGSQEIIDWSSPYVWVAKLDGSATAESQALTDLISIRPSLGQLSDAEIDRVIVSLQRLRKIGRTMFRQSWFITDGARKAGVSLSEEQRR
ncbi:MAG TPA: hypothetical protein VK474_08695, partial [Chthoniobacterales bacterium]|nr:hypothetical protein [Chthoniobacterales bacterium]